ncbi:MAG TPA: alpha-amylase family protein [Chitinophagaceae bacterium]|nr:alpha-amylase family protein [Chitinophagaceae bacterium]
MHRRDFVKNTSLLGGAVALAGSSTFANILSPAEAAWFDKSMRWAQLAFVDNDPGRFDPAFWLDYFKRIHADGALLSAGGVTAFYPTELPLHHRSDFLGNHDLVGELMNGCRKMNMTVCLRTDPHATRQNVYDAHPDWIAVTADGKKRRHWANPELWVTCALGPYNFEFMTEVHKEIMNKYQPEGIFSNRWAGSGICYCEHCVKNFGEFSGGMELPRSNAGTGVSDGTTLMVPTASQTLAQSKPEVAAKYREWNTQRLKDLWFLWDAEIRKIKSTSRFIPNGFPDKKILGQYSDIFFVDRQGRSGAIPTWNNGKGAKELRAGGMGMKPLINIFSVGLEDSPRWKDSVNTDAEIKIWAANGVANGMLPCFVKFGATPIDMRWFDAVEKVFQGYYKSEAYLRNTAPMARVAMVISEQQTPGYGQQPWQRDNSFHVQGMYHNLVESRMPFEMINTTVLDAEHLKPFKLLILANTAALSDAQCDQLRKFVEGGGSLLATFESSLYDENGKQRSDFGLADVFGVSYNKGVEGPMQNSYLRLRSDPATKKFHPVLNGLEDAVRIINGTFRVKVTPKSASFPSPVTLVPTYPDLPMEDVYTRVPDTDIREVYLKEVGKGRVAYIPFDIDRAIWQYMAMDHGKLLDNIVRWTLNEDPIVTVKGPGMIETTVWRQKASMTVHLVNLTNPMMLKGPFRELIPVSADVSIKIPAQSKVKGVKLLLSEQKPKFTIKDGSVSLSVPQLLDHEIVALDFV